MGTPANASAVWRFGVFEIDTRTGELRRSGQSIKLREQPSRILLILVEHAGELVTREQLRQRLWPSDTFVDFDHSLNTAVMKLREALGDSADRPLYIETIPKKGYRFLAPVSQSGDMRNEIAPVSLLPVDPSSASVEPDRSNALADAVDTRISAPEEKTIRWLRRRLFQALAVLLIVSAAGMLWLFGVRATGRHPASEQRVTSNSPEAPVECAVVSPDGKYMAYSDPTGLYLRVIASGETRRWDLAKGFIARPASWFPDGTHLLVARFDGPTPSLWKLSLFGAAPQKLIGNAGPASVSPDGSRIAFVTSPANSGNQLWVMGADGSNPRKIAEASPPEGPTHAGSSIVSPAWSPNSRRIACIEHRWVHAFAPLKDLSSVWTRDADGGDLQVILQDTLLGWALSWAPDGRILFASGANTTVERDEEDIRSIRVDERTGKATGQPQLVTGGVGNIGGITITSDGKRVVLWRQNTQEQAFISEFDASTRKWKTPRRLTLDANGSIATAWLSDSRTVPFVSNRNGTWALFKQAIDETTAEVLVEGHSLYLPRLSADGSQLLYLSQTDPADPSVPISLMRLPVTGGPPQLILRDIALGNYQCARFPSTLCIATKFEKDGVIFFAFDPGRGIGRELLKLSGLVHDWSLSPDGRTLADFPHGHSIHFLSVENEAVKEDRTVTLDEWPVYNGDWNADGSGLLIPSVTPAGTPVILEVNRAGKASVVLEGAANTPFEFMLQAPDGRHGILGAIVPGDNNAWMIDKF